MILQCPDTAASLSECLVIDNIPVQIDWSLSGVSLNETMLVFGGGMFLWAVGLGIGLLIATVRKTRY